MIPKFIYIDGTIWCKTYGKSFCTESEFLRHHIKIIESKVLNKHGKSKVYISKNLKPWVKTNIEAMNQAYDECWSQKQDLLACVSMLDKKEVDLISKVQGFLEQPYWTVNECKNIDKINLG